ncbi:Box C/D snoRNA accumulation [Coemansia sp. RSA 2322]|uniref:Box C/D snoRNA protein 1 n=1 Tax=Coemansia thaxteri TaxID=2663907 RepID=A0A9W8BHX4_9FUNG|nr:Box C/D snoRNA accumulation [Coemansia thaxteri]KAJ2471285.1 Box C/D snoRNA accumulation [Coemansia sp. RSA 2322]KAJ2479728.1 Box C/D snoRNA accumulation [Coemansia sp. RSA 2320]
MSDSESPHTAVRPAADKCEQCSTQDAKYKCPGCLVRTCSLACSKQHKAGTGCSGERDKTKFVRRAEYDANNLISDYGFLQDLARDYSNLAHDAEEQGVKADTTGRQHSSAGNVNGGDSLGIVLTRAQKNIAAKAKSERQVHIRFMSPGIQRHKLNRTIWAASKARLVWTLEIEVPGVDTCPNRWIETGFHDVCSVGDLWSRLLQSGSGSRRAGADGTSSEVTKKRARSDVVRIQLPSNDGAEHPFSSGIQSELLQSLKTAFSDIHPADLIWLIRVQDLPANKPTFRQINPAEPLHTQLRFQTVLEFPTIYVYRQAPTEIGGHAVTIEQPSIVQTDIKEEEN